MSTSPYEEHSTDSKDDEPSTPAVFRIATSSEPISTHARATFSTVTIGGQQPIDAAMSEVPDADVDVPDNTRPGAESAATGWHERGASPQLRYVRCRC